MSFQQKFYRIRNIYWFIYLNTKKYIIEAKQTIIKRVYDQHFWKEKSTFLFQTQNLIDQVVTAIASTLFATANNKNIKLALYIFIINFCLNTI